MKIHTLLIYFFENTCSSFGLIKSVRLPKKMAGTGTHRGFAFVDFTTKQDAKVCKNFPPLLSEAYSL